MTNTKKKAQDLKSGDIINPPAHERSWLKTTLTVIEVTEAAPDKRGAWLWVKASYVSPYGDGTKTSESKFKFRPETMVAVFAAARKSQTFAERIADETKVALAPEFIANIRRIAASSGKTEDEVYTLWRAYSDSCYDQSALLSEFCHANGFPVLA